MNTKNNSSVDIADWRPEDEQFWESTGKRIAYRNLWISVPSLLCGFAVWGMWGIITVQMLNLGFPFSQAELREQLSLAERKAQVEHLDGNDAPHTPDGKAAQQAGHGNPEVAVGNALSGAFPELLVLGTPVGDVHAGIVFCIHESSFEKSSASGPRASRVAANNVSAAHFGPVHPYQRHPDHAIHEHEGAGTDTREIHHHAEQDRQHETAQAAGQTHDATDGADAVS